MTGHNSITIAIADDDEDDRLLIEDAFQDSRLVNPRVYAKDGVELLDYLELECHAGGAALPGLILLDLNMPRLDGRAVLERLKANPRLRRIPVVVLTTSKAQEDIFRTYELGVNSFITKPITFDDLSDIVRTLTHYWIEIVQLPYAQAA